MAWVMRCGVEYGCCRHGASFSVGSVPGISMAWVEGVRMVVAGGGGRSETAGGGCQRRSGGKG